MIHDTHYAACVRPDDPYVGVVDTRAYQPRQGRHHRWPGDMIMAAGMGASGKGDQLLPYMRAFGEDWLRGLYPHAEICEAGSETVNGHTCVRYEIRAQGRLLCIWLDARELIMWKYRVGDESEQESVEYRTVRANHALPPSSFTIPDWVFDKPPTPGATRPPLAESNFLSVKGDVLWLEEVKTSSLPAGAPVVRPVLKVDQAKRYLYLAASPDSRYVGAKVRFTRVGGTPWNDLDKQVMSEIGNEIAQIEQKLGIVVEVTYVP
ncbi:MAG: hypothetical protein GX616_14615 [Planctomycetes bacterium]|nr:hypothetical protein [Planctomycetota bacterium]